ncbi:MAG: hypothetical protein AUI36_21690 [Cyanobacteria bacterium 13_1_40CM_2_61_4]|nr:MAG: hypothetical protein AUI36_21690 [Cyanobacteria bacterium 13_1_40CM_2_61_4]
MQDIGFPAGAFVAGVSGINNAGTAAGGYIRGADFTPRSYIWTSLGGFRDLGIPQSEAAGINNKGHVVGRYNVACVFCDSGHAFLWDRDGVRDLGTLPGQAFSYGWALNVHDQVVGFSGPYAFLWTKTTGMLNLNDLIDSSSGWQLYFAAGINAKGQIVGRGLLNGEEHGALGLLDLVVRKSIRIGNGYNLGDDHSGHCETCRQGLQRRHIQLSQKS